MRLMGCSADMADAILQELSSASRSGLAAIVWSDGVELLGVFAEPGDGLADVLRVMREHVPELTA